MNISFSQSFDDNVPLKDHERLFAEVQNVSLKANDNNVQSNAEPILKISPPTPLKESPKNRTTVLANMNIQKDDASIASEDKSMMKSIHSCKFLESSDALSKDSIISHNKLRENKIYPKKTCPLHKYEPVVKIFDDNIEKYLKEPSESILREKKLHRLPLLQNTLKCVKNKGGIAFAESKKVKRITHSEEKLRYHSDDLFDLDVKEISNVESINKENDVSYIPTNVKYLVDKESRKDENRIKDRKIKSALPELYQSTYRIKKTQDELMTKSLKHVKIPEIQNKFIDNSR